ncbi:MAG TPA: hypothetical protein VHH73_18475 [Verrucomicrobiae bacterium]|nr:hypothetical protein [Verrucomicrobiae bacterium]
MNSIVHGILLQLIVEGPAGAKSIPVLKPLVDMPGFPYSVEAALALWRVSGQQELGLPYLARQLTNSAASRSQVLSLVLVVAEGATALIPSLVVLLEGNDSLVAGQAALVLGQIGPTARVALPALRRACESDRAALRDNARHAIYLIERSASSPAGSETPAPFREGR